MSLSLSLNLHRHPYIHTIFISCIVDGRVGGDGTGGVGGIGGPSPSSLDLHWHPVFVSLFVFLCVSVSVVMLLMLWLVVVVAAVVHLHSYIYINLCIHVVGRCVGSGGVVGDAPAGISGVCYVFEYTLLASVVCVFTCTFTAIFMFGTMSSSYFRSCCCRYHCLLVLLAVVVFRGISKCEPLPQHHRYQHNDQQSDYKD